MGKIFLGVIFGTFAILLSECSIAGPESPDYYTFRLVLILSESGQPQPVGFKQENKDIYPARIVKTYGDDLERLTCRKSLPHPENGFGSDENLDIRAAYFSLVTVSDGYCGDPDLSDDEVKIYVYGLGTIQNKGTENIYILTSTPKEPHRFKERIFANLLPDDATWADSWLWKTFHYYLSWFLRHRESYYYNPLENIFKRFYPDKDLKSTNFLLAPTSRRDGTADIKNGIPLRLSDLLEYQKNREYDRLKSLFAKLYPEGEPRYLDWFLPSDSEGGEKGSMSDSVIIPKSWEWDSFLRYQYSKYRVNAEFDKLRESLTAERVRQIVAEYRRFYRPLTDENGVRYTPETAPLEFPGLTVVAPGETKPIISPEIAPKEYDGFNKYPN